MNKNDIEKNNDLNMSGASMKFGLIPSRINKIIDPLRKDDSICNCVTKSELCLTNKCSTSLREIRMIPIISKNLDGPSPKGNIVSNDQTTQTVDDLLKNLDNIINN